MSYEVTTSINLMFDFDFKYPVIEQIDRINKAGFKYLDFNFSDWSDSFDSPFAKDDWKEWIYSVKEFCDKNGIKFIQAHGPLYNIFGEDTPQKRLRDELSLRSIEAASILGIPWVVFHAGTFDGDFDTVHRQQLKERNIEWFTPLVKACEKYNTGIAIENMASAFGKHHNCKSCYCAYTDDLIELVDSFNSDRVGICWDTGHANVNKSNQPYDLKKIGKRLKALHIQDNDGINDQHLPPYLGNIDWNAIMKALHEIDFDGPFTFEAHTEIRKVPEPCKDTAMQLLLKTGEYLVGLK